MLLKVNGGACTQRGANKPSKRAVHATGTTCRELPAVALAAEGAESLTDY